MFKANTVNANRPESLRSQFNNSEGKRLDNLILQLRTMWLAFLFVSVASAFFLGVVLVIHFWKGVRIHDLTSDPLLVMGGASYIGFLSQIGIFFWAASAAVCFFAASVVSGEPSVRMKSFFFASGLLSLFLGLDDVFQLHDEFFPSIGVPEKITYASYVGFTLLWLIQFRPIILITEYLLLGTAFLFFSLSIALDVVTIHLNAHYFFEDGAKLIGIISWLTYFYRSAIFVARNNTVQKNDAPDVNSASSAAANN